MIIIIEDIDKLYRKWLERGDEHGPDYSITWYLPGKVESIEPQGINGFTITFKTDPPDPLMKEFKVMMTIEELERIAGDEAMKNVRKATEEEKAASTSLNELVVAHVTGKGTQKRAEVDYGIKCTLCGRSTYVLDIYKDEHYLGCAYAIGGGLCTNYVILTDNEFRALQDDMNSVDNMQKVMAAANKRLDRERKKICEDMDVQRETCIHYVPGSKEARRYIYCSHPDEIKRIKEQEESKEYYTICCPQTCKHFAPKRDKSNEKS